MLLVDFRVRRPEFDGVIDAEVQAALDDAATEIAACKWGALSTVAGTVTRADVGHMYLAAHNLAVSPFGQNARMAVKQQNGEYTSVYEVGYRRLQREVSAGFRVA